MIMVVVALVGTPVGFFVIKEAARDPIFAELDGWNVPEWAAGTHHDEAYGSRWCYRECRFRERTWKSSRPAEETNQAFASALRAAGWRTWEVAGCPPEGVQGLDSCWQRDEYVLDLWVRDEPCEIKPVRPTVGSGQPAVPDPSASSSAEPSGIPGPGCGTSQATVKVFNRIAYQRGN
jgi:integrin beta 3